MAKISRRFENPKGRSVERIDARVTGLSGCFAEHTRVGGNPKVEGLGIHVKTRDGRDLTLVLTHAEIDWLVEYRTDLDQRYGRP